MRRLFLAGTCWLGVLAPAVQVGDPRAAVLAELGEPQSKLSAGGREFLQYPQGRVVIADGRVSELRGNFLAPGTLPPPVASRPAPPPPPAVTAPAARPAAARARTAHWYTDIAEAEAAAARDNKRILALFTGTDWCGPCQQFKAEVEHDEQFAGIFAGSFIFFKSDWLRNTPQPAAVEAEVGRLRRKYGIQGYPSLLVLNAAGETLARVEWTKVQAGSFKEAMIEAIDDARKATKDGRKVSGGWWPF